MTPEPLLTGVYRHYKGPLYLVLGLAHDANADGTDAGLFVRTETYEHGPLLERTVVVYVGLQLDEAHHGARLAVRTASDFHALLHPDATVCPDAMRETPLDWFCHCRACDDFVRLTPRFAYVGPTWEGDGTRSTDLETLIKLLASDPTPFGSESFQRIRDQINPRMRALLLDVLS